MKSDSIVSKISAQKPFRCVFPSIFHIFVFFPMRWKPTLLQRLYWLANKYIFNRYDEALQYRVNSIARQTFICSKTLCIDKNCMSQLYNLHMSHTMQNTTPSLSQQQTICRTQLKMSKRMKKKWLKARLMRNWRKKRNEETIYFSFSCKFVQIELVYWTYETLHRNTKMPIINADWGNRREATSDKPLNCMVIRQTHAKRYFGFSLLCRSNAVDFCNVNGFKMQPMKFL